MPRTPEVPESDKIIHNEIRRIFCGKRVFSRFWDESENSYIDLFNSVDDLQRGVTSYSTIGLSRAPLIYNDNEYVSRDGTPVGVEILGACYSNTKYFDNALTTAAFCIINSKWFCCPGAIFYDVLKMYDISQTMKHLTFFKQHMWEGKFDDMHVSGRLVTWLQAIPISDGERVYTDNNGPDAMKELFDKEQVDIFDLNRESVL